LPLSKNDNNWICITEDNLVRYTGADATEVATGKNVKGIIGMNIKASNWLSSVQLFVHNFIAIKISIINFL
jgi:hypothetical protein